jgi:hypothetical protein
MNEELKGQREYSDLREDGMEWIGLIWLRIGTNGGLLLTRY